MIDVNGLSAAKHLLIIIITNIWICFNLFNYIIFTNVQHSWPRMNGWLRAQSLLGRNHCGIPSRQTAYLAI